MNSDLLPANLEPHLRNFKAIKPLMQKDYSTLKHYLENGGKLGEYDITFINIDAERISHNKSVFNEIYMNCMVQIDVVLQFAQLMPEAADLLQTSKSLIEQILQAIDELEQINEDTQELVTVYTDAETSNALQLSLRRISPLNTDTQKHIFSFLRKTPKTIKSLKKGGNRKRRHKPKTKTKTK